jgi:hypothetical protein
MVVTTRGHQLGRDQLFRRHSLLDWDRLSPGPRQSSDPVPYDDRRAHWCRLTGVSPRRPVPLMRTSVSVAVVGFRPTVAALVDVGWGCQRYPRHEGRRKCWLHSLGVCGVFAGAVLTRIFANPAEWRSRRLEAMVQVAAASGRVIGVHEYLYGFFLHEQSPPLSEDRVITAFRERSAAHNEWRSERARLEIVITDDPDFYRAMNEFETYRMMATEWTGAYQKEGSEFDYKDYANVDKESWRGMRSARYEIMACARNRSQRDARWNGRLRLRFAKPDVVPIGYPNPR